MNTSKRLPEIADVGHFFTMLFGPETRCQTRRQPLDLNASAVVAEYQDTEGQIKRLLVCDLAFANSAGAALSLISPGIANSATKANKYADSAFDNLAEVMNMAVNLFTESFGGRLEFARVVKRSDFSSDVENALVSAPRTRVDVAIPRYDLGRVDMVAVR